MGFGTQIGFRVTNMDNQGAWSLWLGLSRDDKLIYYENLCLRAK